MPRHRLVWPLHRSIPGAGRAALLMLCAALWFGCPPARAARAPDLNLADTVADVMPTAVAIVATTVEPSGGAKDQPPKVSHERGSGFIVDPDGTIVTNKHVVSGASEVTVTLDSGISLPATVVGESTKADIAVLRVTPRRPLPTARWGDSNKVRVGDTVIAIGNPLGFDSSVSAGIVSALNRNIMESPFDDYIQTDAAINHGNSGGPLFNIKGEVVGMNSVIFAPDNGGFIGLGFAIPSNDVRFVVDQIRRYGFVKAGQIGVQFQDVNPNLRESLGLPVGAGGAIVVEVDPSGGAAQAGIRVGDVILQVRNQRITDARALARAIVISRVGAKAPIQVWRDGAVQKFDVAVTQAPETMPSGPAGAQYPRSAAESMAQGLGLALEPATQVASASAPGNRPADRTGPGSGTQQATNPSASRTQMDGARVSRVDPGSAAAQAGLKVGDVIVMTERGGVSSPTDVMRALDSARMANKEYAPILVRGPDGDLRWTALAAHALKPAR
ncbi:MAG: hypothetical protein BGO51_07605 [Rhodospirillales bacterium 69-11]|nr:trypsin-like peptidase domain-containing protein [Rhodospirillales bacterium]OJW24255.1 MAG: hypothetical protein BGO51_07605 [Rhodospirillales bacterium 69-11]